MVISKTPLRLGLAGGGTDIESFYRHTTGAVVNCTIDKYIYITVNYLPLSNDYIVYGKHYINLDDIEHGIIRECLRLFEVEPGIEITSSSDLPGGTGLGSSSAFTVGLITALDVYCNGCPTMTTKAIAEMACTVEIDMLGSPIGKQDQYAAAYGGLNLFQFYSDGTVAMRPMALKTFAEKNYMMFYTGGTRSANKILKEQGATMSQHLETMEEMRNLALDVYERRVDIGKALSIGWEKKKTLAAGITNNHIERLYNIAMEHGALNGKLIGAGGSGFLLFEVAEGKEEELANAMYDEEAYEVKFAPTDDCSYIIYQCR